MKFFQQIKVSICVILVTLLTQVTQPSILLAIDNLDFIESPTNPNIISLNKNDDNAFFLADLKIVNDFHPIDLDQSLYLYDLGIRKLSENDWDAATSYFDQALKLNPDLAIAQSSKALIDYQLGEINKANRELRIVIRRYPLLADARAALSALLLSRGLKGEAESHWVAAIGLDNHYADREWLINDRHWPPNPINDLQVFLES